MLRHHLIKFVCGRGLIANKNPEVQQHHERFHHSAMSYGHADSDALRHACGRMRQCVIVIMTN